jgi:hypothetical protein
MILRVTICRERKSRMRSCVQHLALPTLEIKEIGEEGRSLSPRDSWNHFATRQTAPLCFFPLIFGFSSPCRVFFLGRHVAWRPSRSYLFNLSVCVFCVCACLELLKPATGSPFWIALWFVSRHLVWQPLCSSLVPIYRFCLCNLCLLAIASCVFKSSVFKIFDSNYSSCFVSSEDLLFCG